MLLTELETKLQCKGHGWARGQHSSGRQPLIELLSVVSDESIVQPELGISHVLETLYTCLMQKVLCRCGSRQMNWLQQGRLSGSRPVELNICQVAETLYVKRKSCEGVDPGKMYI